MKQIIISTRAIFLAFLLSFSTMIMMNSCQAPLDQIQHEEDSAQMVEMSADKGTSSEERKLTPGECMSVVSEWVEFKLYDGTRGTGPNDNSAYNTAEAWAYLECYFEGGSGCRSIEFEYVIFIFISAS